VDGRLCAQWWAEHLEPVGGRGRLPASDLGLGWVGVGQGTPLSWDADGSVQLFEAAGQGQAEESGGHTVDDPLLSCAKWAGGRWWLSSVMPRGG
jgi:hypothetical protein